MSKRFYRLHKETGYSNENELDSLLEHKPEHSQISPVTLYFDD